VDRLQNVGFLLKELSRRYVTRFEAHARSLSLTLMQCKVLVFLQRTEGTCQARLAELTEVEPMMMGRLLDRMEEDKLIERRSDPEDRRARNLYLTAKAKPLLDEIWRLAAAVRGEMFAGVPKADREVFVRVLESALGNLCALDRDAAARVPAAGRLQNRGRRAASS